MLCTQGKQCTHLLLLKYKQLFHVHKEFYIFYKQSRSKISKLSYHIFFASRVVTETEDDLEIMMEITKACKMTK